MISFSAPGKVHLLGEHAVVHGKPALLSAINARLTVTFSKKKLQVLSPETQRLKEVAEAAVKQKFPGIKIPVYSVEIQSELPMGGGLGSSAAASAAYSACLLTLIKKRPTKELVNELAYECEKTFNGNPSGGDNSTVVFGGFVWFRKESEPLKIIWPVPFPIHPQIGQFMLINSGKPAESTKEMVELVRVKSLESRVKTKRIFDDQERLTRELLNALKDGDEKEMMIIIKAGERNLEKLGVVGKIAANIIKEVEKSGGVAKIIGGGGVKKGSGMLLVYHPDQDKLIAVAKGLKLEYISTQLGAEGLKKENGS